jgi:hypothetical protein
VFHIWPHFIHVSPGQTDPNGPLLCKSQILSQKCSPQQSNENHNTHLLVIKKVSLIIWNSLQHFIPEPFTRFYTLFCTICSSTLDPILVEMKIHCTISVQSQSKPQLSLSPNPPDNKRQILQLTASKMTSLLNQISMNNILFPNHMTYLYSTLCDKYYYLCHKYMILSILYSR